MQRQQCTCRRWFVDVSAREPTSLEWKKALASLSEDEQAQINRFMFVKDQRLALGSRLLQRAIVHNCFQVPWNDIVILRTPERKPFWHRLSSYPSYWNFNVSHHGTMVAIASDCASLVGVDVMQFTERPRNTTIQAFFRAFTDYFTPTEWNFIHSFREEDVQYKAFYQLWSLKEAYIKAIGIGLGFQLLRAEFFQSDMTSTQWQMRLDGKVATDWSFESYELDAQHVVSIARGPVNQIWNSTTSNIFPSSIDTTHDDDDLSCCTAPSWQQLDWSALDVQ